MENRKPHRGMRTKSVLGMVVVLVGGLVVAVPAPAAADPFCVYTVVTDVCDNLLIGDPPRKLSVIVATGTTSGHADTNWVATLPDITGPEAEEAAAATNAALDEGTYAQSWNIIYEGDAECVEITGDYWHSQGWMYVIYHTWSWTGDSSSGSGSRPGSVSAGRVSHMEVVDAEGSNQALCDSLRQAAFERAATTSQAYASLNFGEWKAEGGATGSWRPGSISACLTGPVVIGPTTLSSSVRHTMSPGGRIASGSFSIDGGSTIAGVPVEWSGKGDIKPCLSINNP